MCRVLLINRRCYCAWFKTPHSARALDNMALLGEIKQFYAASGNIYGGPRICRDRKAAGLACSETLVAKLMYQAKLYAVRGYSKTRYKAGKSAIDAPNRLRQVFVAIRPDVVWVTDITQIYIH
jgi:putative transposase